MVDSKHLFNYIQPHGLTKIYTWIVYLALWPTYPQGYLDAPCACTTYGGQISKYYDISFAAAAKHLSVLQKAKLITKQRRGKEQVVSIVPDALHDASYYLKRYEQLWSNRFYALADILKEDA